MTDRLVHIAGREVVGDGFILDFVTQRGGGERHHDRVLIGDVETARNVLSEVSRLRGWISHQQQPPTTEERTNS